MTYKTDVYQLARAKRLLVAVLALGPAFGTAANAQQLIAPLPSKVAVPATSVLITPPVGNSAFLVGHAEGTQGYVCLPTATGATTASWTVNNARPEATLFQSFFGLKFEIITHFLSPNTNPKDTAPRPIPFGSATWQSSQDSSKVWAQVLHGNMVPAGSEPACPNNNSIACLLLEAVGSEDGPTGGNILSKTTFVQRLNTNGGLAPEAGCFTSTDVGKQALVPYTADYYFFRKDQ